MAYSSNTYPFQTWEILPENMDHLFMPIKNNMFQKPQNNLFTREAKYKACVIIHKLKIAFWK